MPPLRTVSRDTPKGRHFTKKQPLKGAVFCFQRPPRRKPFSSRRSIPLQLFNPAAVVSPAAVVQSRSSRSVRHSRSIPLQLFSPAAVVQSAAAAQSCSSISNRLASPRGFVTVTNAFRPSR